MKCTRKSQCFRRRSHGSYVLRRCLPDRIPLARFSCSRGRTDADYEGVLRSSYSHRFHVRCDSQLHGSSLFQLHEREVCREAYSQMGSEDLPEWEEAWNPWL